MSQTSLTEPKRRIMDLLKRGGQRTAGTLAASVGLTDVAIRQHLATLETLGLVEPKTRPPSGRGRPAILWSLTELARGLFPERHAELTVSLIQSTRKAFGDEGLKKIIDLRAAEQVRDYRTTLPPTKASLQERVHSLAQLRTAEGYMAEVKREAKNVFQLIEHHCPICDAAKCCQGLCSAELDVFQRSLGEDVLVERVEHLLSGDTRCVYRITARTDIGQ